MGNQTANCGAIAGVKELVNFLFFSLARESDANAALRSCPRQQLRHGSLLYLAAAGTITANPLCVEQKQATDELLSAITKSAVLNVMRIRPNCSPAFGLTLLPSTTHVLNWWLPGFFFSSSVPNPSI